MRYRVLICVFIFLIIGTAGCAPAAPSAVFSETSAVSSSQPKYILSAEDAAKIESYKELPDSDEEIIAEYHYQFDLYDYLKTSLAERGYTEEQIAQIDKQDYEILTKDWPINPNNPSGRTYGDLEEEGRIKYEKYKQDRMPTPEQQARLDELGIEDWLLWEMLDEGYDSVEVLLNLPEEKLTDLRDVVAGAILIGEAFENRRQMIRTRYYEITGGKPFVNN